MTKVDQPDYAFSADAEAEGERFRSFSRMAGLSIALGLLSSLVLVHPLFLFVPIIATVLAIVALKQIALRPGELTGRPVALCGLILAMFFAGLGPTRAYMAHKLLLDDARRFSDRWVELVREGKLYEAYELHLRPPERQLPGSDFQQYYGILPKVIEKPRMTPMEYSLGRLQPRNAILAFYAEAPLKQMVEAGPDAKIAFEEVTSIDRHRGTDIVALRYVMTYNEDGREETIRFHIEMRRNYNARSGGQWWHTADVLPMYESLSNL